MQLVTNRKKRGAAIINVTSLIDVVLLLLIFFMLTTRFVEQPGMKLDLPQAQSSQSSKPQENILLVNAQGDLLLNDEKIEIGDLNLKLSALIDTSSTENALVLKGDRTVEYGSVVKIMDIAKLAGFQTLIIATEKE